MKTTITTLLFMLLATFAQAGQSPRKIVFAYECKQINPAETGFECRTTKEGVILHWHENPSKMSPERKEYALYSFERIALRHLNLGGHRFYVLSDHWPKGKMKLCSWRKKMVDHNYYCSDI